MAKASKTANMAPESPEKRRVPSPGRNENHEGCHPCQDSRQKIKEQEFLASHGSLHLRPEKEKPQHVDEQMHDIGVSEHIG